MTPSNGRGVGSPNSGSDPDAGTKKGAVPELEEFVQEGPPIEEPEITVLPEQTEFYRVPRRFGSIPVDALPLGCDSKKQYYGIYPRIPLPFQRVERVSFGHPDLDPNRLFFGDNLHVMRMLPSESIDLIYIDPPFFSGRDYNFIFGDANEIRSFSDIWEGGMPGYLTWLNARLLEMKRLLKPTGSIYVHLDWHASHYVKVELDKIFGYDNFINEIVWCYRAQKMPDSRKKLLSRVTDVILSYGKTQDYKFNHLKLLRDTPLRTTLKKKVAGKIQNVRDDSGNVMYTEYTDRLADNVWDIHLGARSAEKVGYPTQKPIELMQRIVEIGSGEGDLLADFFCGGGSFAVAAAGGRIERDAGGPPHFSHVGKARRFIACDSSRIAVAITVDRLTKLVTRADEGATTVQQTLHPTPDISIEHWGVYEVPSLTRLSELEFRQFVIAAYNGRVASTGDIVHGYKDGVPLHVGPASQEVKITKDAVLDFAEAVVTKKGKNRGTMLAWSFSDSATRAAQRIEEDSDLSVDLVKIALVQIESHEFRDHVVSKHKEYADLLVFILPPEVRVSHKRLGPRTYEFDISESASMNPGGKVMNVQWDFDHKGRFASTKGYSFIRSDSGDPKLSVAFEFAALGPRKVACKVQDDRGGEKTEAFEISVT